MSVINKMLRDLDHRQSPDVAASGLGLALRGGAASVTAEKSAPRAAKGPGPRWRWAVPVGVFAALLVTAWAWQSGFLAQSRTGVAAVQIPAPAPPMAAAPVAALPVSAPVPLAPGLPSDAAVLPALGTTVGDLRMDYQLSPRKRVDAPATTPVPNRGPALGERTPAQAAPPAAPHVSAAAPTEHPPALTDTDQGLQRPQQASKEAIAHAQSLWNSGAKDAAIDLLQDATIAAERAAVAAPANVPMLGALARELTRMQLADARPGSALAVLTRLEPLLGNVPDLWAVRANAAQRLGQHQESVRAYLIALQSRPGEQRWLLGAAVSLAASGQTASAADMVDKARAIGPIGAEVLAYLRQMGVPLVDRAGR